MIRLKKRYLSSDLSRLILNISLFCFTNLSYAERAASDSIDTILKASEELMIEQKRAEAIGLLKEHLSTFEGDQSKKVREISQLKEQILLYSKAFLSEEGQRLHGLGADAIEESPDRAKVWLSSSHQRERETNLIVIKDLTRLFFRQNKCDEAIRLLSSAKELVPFDSGLVIYSWQALECLDRGEEVFAQMTEEILTEPLFQENPFVSIYKSRQEVRGGNIQKGSDLLKALKKSHPEFPEVSYWLWKLDPKEGQIDIAHANEYVKLCQDLSPRYKTELFRLGYVCGHLQIVEAYLQANQ